MKKVALNRGRDFAASIMKDIEEIPESNGMRIMRDVMSLESGMERDIVIRDITQPYWEECINMVMRSDMRVRVYALGNPGIGKTISTSFLIRMLFEKKHTVVYRLKSEDYFWEFEWKNEGYDVAVYPEKDGIRDVGTLCDASTFYIVDAGIESESCLPESSFNARTIIVSSPDETNWAGGLGCDGLRMFMYFPNWDLDELLMARPYMKGAVPTDEEVMARFREVGGVPRHILLNEEDFLAILHVQNAAISALTVTEATQIVQGKLDVVGSFANQPRSSIIGYTKPKIDGKMF